jgi:predicted phosphodiesterase
MIRPASLLILVLIAGHLLFPVAAEQGAAGDVPALVRGPYLVPAGPGALAVHVWTDRPVDAWVESGPEPELAAGGNFSRITASAGPAVHHRILLADLSPGTRYIYRVRYGGASTGELHFLTCPVAGPVTFLVMGDSQDQPPGLVQEERFGVVAARAAAEPGVHFIVHTGDFVGDGEREADWDRFFRIGGVLLANTTLLPVRGNHDGSAGQFADLFGIPPNYTYSCGSVQVVVLDSMDDAWNSLPARARWLDDALDHGPPVRFAALHYPLFSSDERHFGGWENLRNAFAPVLARAGVPAVFQGHVHVYERDRDGGIEYITDGRAGGPPYSFGPERIPGYRAGIEDTLGYSRVTVMSPVLPALLEVVRVADLRDGKVIPVPPGEEVVERVTLVPQGAGGPMAISGGTWGPPHPGGNALLAQNAFLGQVIELLTGPPSSPAT